MKKIVQFFREIRTEVVDKTTWPSRDEVLNTTIVVSMSILIISLMLYGVDIVSSMIVQFIVVEQVSRIKVFVSEFTFILFAFVLLLGVVIYNRIKARVLR